MIGSNIILFPDTGEEFISSLKTAILYSEKVHVLTLSTPDLGEIFSNLPSELEPFAPFKRLKQYGDSY